MSGDALFLKRLYGTPKVITASVTRPADTTAYAQADTVSDSTSSATMLTFSGVAKTPGGAFMLSHMMMWDSSAASGVKPDIDLYLLNATLATPPVDNGVWAPSDSEALTVIEHVLFDGNTGFLTLNTGSNASGNGLIQSGNIGRLLVCASGSTSLYGVPRIGGIDGYTPVSAEVFTFALVGWQL